MTLNERILDFLDGSLPADDEAELLHTLSVSPEKRNVLRGFMLQGALFTRDAKSLSVPYKTEQRLWARMDHVLPVPATEDAGTAIVPFPSNNAGFFARAFSGASSPMMRAALGALTLLAGIGIGYIAGHSQSATDLVTKGAAHVSSGAPNSPTIASSNESNETHETVGSYGTHRINKAISPIASALPVADQQESAPLVPPPAANNDGNTVPITPVAAINTPAITVADIGGDGVVGIRPLLHHVRPSREENPSLISRFEFRVDESFGRQFPNNSATTVSQPDLTNLSLSAFFQVFPHSNVLWAGLAGGSANIAHTALFSQAIDPSQNVLASDTTSSQTRYLEALAELRLPAFETAYWTLTAGYGFATLGQLMSGEIGLHYDLSNEAGVQCGLRVLGFTYNLSSEKTAAIASSSTSSLTIPSGIPTTGFSYNAELNLGLFFHF